MKTLVFDIESNGYPHTKPPPALVEIAWTTLEEDVEVECYQVALDSDVKYDVSAGKCHGITEQQCRDAPPAAIALNAFKEALNTHDIVVSHGIAGDCSVVSAAAEKAGVHLIWPEKICTMLKTTPILKLKGTYGRGYKWPSMTELCAHYNVQDALKEIPDGERGQKHSAAGDVRTLKAICRIMTSKGQIRRSLTGLPQRGPQAPGFVIKT